MFWFGKKKNKKRFDEEEKQLESEDEADTSETESEKTYSQSYSSESDSDTENDDLSEKTEDAELELPDVTVKISSLDDLAEFVNSRTAGSLQFMYKETLDAFEIRESHIRMAEVWGSISMARECTPIEYAKIMLAIELTENPERFYVIPGLTENEVKQAIKNFCSEYYGDNGKKYAADFSKFSDFVKKQGDLAEWKAFTKEAVYDKLTEFCENNCIEFSGEDAQGDE